jgi:hypothetical protein
MEEEKKPSTLIDPALLPLFDFLKKFTRNDYFTNTEVYEAYQIENIKLNLPLDLQIIQNKDRSLTLGGSTPNMYAPISLTPVYHRVKITIALSNDVNE